MNWRLAAAAAWTLLIVLLCSIPGPDLPGPSVVGMDKVAHFTLFGVFAWLWLDATGGRLTEAVLWVVVGGLLLAGLTEVYQGLLPFDREPSLADAVANAAGLLTGAGLHRVRAKQGEAKGS